MQIVINIPEDVIKDAKDSPNYYPTHLFEMIWRAIVNGIPLPKGHGKLIDGDEILKAMNTWEKFGYTETGCLVRNPGNDYVPYVHYADMVKAVSGMPTIIEADTEAENEDSN